jgi:hypothetical protein
MRHPITLLRFDCGEEELVESYSPPAIERSNFEVERELRGLNGGRNKKKREIERVRALRSSRPLRSVGLTVVVLRDAGA